VLYKPGKVGAVEVKEKEAEKHKHNSHPKGADVFRDDAARVKYILKTLGKKQEQTRPEIRRIDYHKAGTQFPDNFRNADYRLVKYPRIIVKVIPRGVDKVGDLPVKLKAHECQGDKDEDDGSQRKDRRQDAPYDLPPERGEIYTPADPLVKGTEQYIRQNRPQEHGKERREESAHQKEQ
jgi:hypothetical protein